MIYFICNVKLKLYFIIFLFFYFDMIFPIGKAVIVDSGSSPEGKIIYNVWGWFKTLLKCIIFYTLLL